MEYLHMQQPLDGLWHNFTMTGVPVVLTAIDSKNNVYDIGTTTSNAYDGTYGMAWIPPSADTYHKTASFAGTWSYGSSSAGTSPLVSAAATITPAPTATTATLTLGDITNSLVTYIAVAAVAIIIAIVIVGIVLYRKHA